MDDLSGKTVKGYELQAQVGAGGFGAVYRAKPTSGWARGGDQSNPA